jgi:uncharacterized membrane protein YbhN (UPF0104 family)
MPNVREAVQRIGFDFQKRHLLAGLLPLGLIALLAASPHLLGDQVRDGLDGIGEARPVWLWLAAGGFAGSLVCSGLAWRLALSSLGARITCSDAAARYGVGSLVNSLAPAKLGTAVRLALFAQPLRGEGRLWTVGGIGTAIGAAHTFWLAILVAIAASAGVVPTWPLAILGALLLAAGGAVYVARHSRPARRFAHLLDAFRELGSSPRRAAMLLGVTGLSMLARVAAAAALAAAFGLPHPLAVAVLVVPAVEMAAFLPLTPGNIGVASAAVAFALRTRGIDGDVALSVGIAFNAVETLVSLAFGAGSGLYLASGTSLLRRRLATVAGAVGCAAVASAFSWTVLLPLS